VHEAARIVTQPAGDEIEVFETTRALAASTGLRSAPRARAISRRCKANGSCPAASRPTRRHSHSTARTNRGCRRSAATTQRVAFGRMCVGPPSQCVSSEPADAGCEVLQPVRQV
jgi:hypothetical protein